jgi:hypothetical protein
MNDRRKCNDIASQVGEEGALSSLVDNILIFIAIWSDLVLGKLLCRVLV